MYRSQRDRERDMLQKRQKVVADLANKITSKRRELARTSSASRQRSLTSDIERLERDWAKAQQAVADQQRKVIDAETRVTKEELREQRASSTYFCRTPGRIKILPKRSTSNSRRETSRCGSTVLS